MIRRLILICCVVGIATSALGQTAKKISKKAASGPDKTYMQQIWDGWASLDPSHVAPFYATGMHTFFDITPLKYSSWDEYQAGAKKLLAAYKGASFSVNDDAEVHRERDWAWGTATVKSDMTTTGGKHEMGSFRWTVLWQKQNSKWLIVHEHVSAPMQ